TFAARMSSSGAAEEALFKTRSGEEKPVELTVSSIAGRGGASGGYVVIARDISERKTLESDLKAAIAEGREVVTPVAARREEVADLARSLASWERFSRQRSAGSQAMSELSSLTRVEDVTRVGLERMAELFDAGHGSICVADPDGLRGAAVVHGNQAADQFRVGALLRDDTPIGVAMATGHPVAAAFEAGAWSE